MGWVILWDQQIVIMIRFLNYYSIAERSKYIQGKAHELADEFYAVSSEIQRFSNLLKAAEIPQSVMLYDKVS